VTDQSQRRIRPSGGYRELRSFAAATILYDTTVTFCERFLDKRSRTVDQMVQAARSGRQNIAEGSRAAATSSQTELRLINVARASLDELLLDYEDFLRQRRLPAWTKEHPEAVRVRDRWKEDRTDRTDQSDLYTEWLDCSDPGVVANAMICLIHQTNYLLDRQINALEKAFIGDGGYSENLAAARLAQRQRARQAAAPVPIPDCPRCGKLMALRTARTSGTQFWGCTAYPDCKGTRKL